MTKHKVTVQQAADVLDTSVDAIRQRIKRGKLHRAEADDPTDNRVYVWLDGDQPKARHDLEDEASPNVDPLVESLQDQVEHLREQLAAERRANDENRRLLLAALERIPPQLEPPSEAEDAPESPVSPGPTLTPAPTGGERGTATETSPEMPMGSTPSEASEGPQEAAEERPGFWSRLFGRGG
jgi:hypothetical protein